MYAEPHANEELIPDEELIVHEELDLAEELSEDEDSPEEDYEEITSEEVDRVVATLEDLIDSVQSENIKAYLQEASNNVFYLIYEDDDAQPEAA